MILLLINQHLLCAVSNLNIFNYNQYGGHPQHTPYTYAHTYTHVLSLTLAYIKKEYPSGLQENRT